MRRLLSAISYLFTKTHPDNTKRHPWLPHTYTIRGADGSPYLTRTLFPRLWGRRVLLHHIHRPDEHVEHLHDHPWDTAVFRILHGGYTERRADDLGATFDQTFRPGDVNRLMATSFHSVIDVLPHTWTIGVVGKRIQEWGFRVDGAIVPNGEYLKARRV